MTTKTNDDYNARAAKGQAMNLAALQAIHEGRAEDTRYIYALFCKYFELGKILQSADIEDVKKVIGLAEDSPETKTERKV